MPRGVHKLAVVIGRARHTLQERVWSRMRVSMRTNLRLQYPLWCAICLVAFVLAPSFSCQDVRLSLGGPVSLGLIGLTESAVDVHLEDHVMAVEREPIRAQERVARAEPRVQKKETLSRAVREAKRTIAAYRYDSLSGMMGPSVGNGTPKADAEVSHVERVRLVAEVDDADGKKMISFSKERPVFNPLPYSKLIDSIARKNGVSPALAAAVIKVESGFKPHARSNRGAKGLMQLLPATARKVGVSEDIYHPENNIRAGVRYLKEMLDRYDGDEKLALAAYNAGPGAVDRYNNIPPYRETKAYVPRVLQYVKEYSKYFRDI